MNTPIQRALLSVSDKTGLIDFARALHQRWNVQLISTGGTAKHLRQAGLPVREIAEITQFPEIMDGRVKTLHPKVHGGLLARRDVPEHLQAMQQHGIEPIDLVCINLYPFVQTIARADCTFEQGIENIDIGGPSMIRSAAKNHHFVAVVTDPDQYPDLLADLDENAGAPSAGLRLELARQAFATTAEYDAAIAAWLLEQRANHQGAASAMPGRISLSLQRKQELRYGENPHQPAALYVDPDEPRGEPSVAYARQLHGKELSYINLLDADAALACAREFAQPAACIVKHATPCGCAVGADLPEAFTRAYQSDPLAAFGGIVALNGKVDLATASAITSIDKLLEVIVSFGYDPAAEELLRARWKNVRLLEVGADPQAGAEAQAAAGAAGYHLHRIVGGYLVQRRDLAGVEQSAWKVVSARQPSERELRDLAFAWLVCKHVKSNAVVLAGGGMLLGAGAGQMDRVAASRLAVEKAGPRATGSVAASDAFFPFPDGPELLLNSGVTAIIQPGGSLRDAATIELVNARNACMVFTGQRHFRH